MLCMTFPNPSFASLGGDSSTVQNDQAHLQATLRKTPTSSYTLHELQAASGQVIHEYVSASGKVFAVTWHGPFRPDLEQLLGSHFEEYRQALRQRAGARGPVTVQLPGLVVQLGGHMRDFVGRAYLPDELPAGVRAEDLR